MGYDDTALSLVQTPDSRNKPYSVTVTVQCTPTLQTDVLLQILRLAVPERRVLRLKTNEKMSPCRRIGRNSVKMSRRGNLRRYSAIVLDSW